MTQFAAIILAGGRSSRMGRDKAAIAIQGQPFLKKICFLASQCASQVYVITPWIEKYQAIAPGDCQMIREVALPGETEPHGPLIGFAQALTYVKTEWVLLLACDLPNLTESEIQKWSSYLETTPPEAIAALPKSSKGWEPLCGFYRRRCLSVLNEFIDGGGRSFQRWLEQHPVRELPVSDANILFNCNTPADLEQIQKG
ncbi:MAG: molybdenum cofactor guanylyltransferase [Hydrococcus sp. C42_A2020_068]|nr:molybdenum cofactor guanylyltransferase [Hydrococcus sp. C42_A2020_068]